ncbi:hypothetical protein [Burkholderia stabilis]
MVAEPREDVGRVAALGAAACDGRLDVGRIDDVARPIGGRGDGFGHGVTLRSGGAGAGDAREALDVLLAHERNGERVRERCAVASRVPDTCRSTRENHAAARRPMTRRRVIEGWRFIIDSLRMDFIFCFRESTAIRAGESITPRAGVGESDKTYLFFTDLDSARFDCRIECC